MLVDPGQAKVADDDAALPQGLGESGGVLVGWWAKTKLAAEGTTLEAQSGQVGDELLAVSDDGPTGRSKYSRSSRAATAPTRARRSRGRN